MSRLNDIVNSIITEQADANKKQIMDQAFKTVDEYLKGMGFVYDGLDDASVHSWSQSSGPVMKKITIEYAEASGVFEAHGYVFISTQQVFHTKFENIYCYTCVRQAIKDTSAWLANLKDKYLPGVIYIF